MVETTESPNSHRKMSVLLRDQGGMTFLFVMMLAIFMSISVMKIPQQWSVIMKRDREAELLFRGNRIKEAIEKYVGDYEVQKATRPNRWPRTLKDLTKKSPKRYLQKAYSDPITGEEFVLIKIGEELHGVKSASTDTPFNQVDFKGAKTYREIRFEATGMASNCQINPLNPNAPCVPSATPGLPAPGTPAPGTSVPQAPGTGAPAAGIPVPAETPAPSPSEPIPAP